MRSGEKKGIRLIRLKEQTSPHSPIIAITFADQLSISFDKGVTSESRPLEVTAPITAIALSLSPLAFSQFSRNLLWPFKTWTQLTRTLSAMTFSPPSFCIIASTCPHYYFVHTLSYGQSFLRCVCPEIIESIGNDISFTIRLMLRLDIPHNHPQNYNEITTLPN